MSNVQLFPADEYSQLIEQRLRDWRRNFVFKTAEDEWVFSQYVISSVRLERCAAEEPVMRGYSALRAELSWDEDRRLDAEEIAARLARRPALVVRRLMKTRQGCEWLIERWRELSAVLEHGGGRDWNDAERSLAFDLLGAHPTARHRDPWREGGSARELTRRQVELLEERKVKSLDRLDALEREAARRGAPIHLPRPLARLRWYEAYCTRRFLWAREILKGCLPEPPKQPEPTPGAEPDPDAEPRVHPSDLADGNDTRPSEQGSAEARPPVAPTPTTAPAPRSAEPVAVVAVPAASQSPPPSLAPAPTASAFVPIRISDCLKPNPAHMNHKMRRAARRKAARGR
jgi:hypothetical protein